MRVRQRNREKGRKSVSLCLFVSECVCVCDRENKGERVCVTPFVEKQESRK